MPHPVRSLQVLVLAGTLAGLALPGHAQTPLGQQDALSLGLTGQKTPDALKAIAANPYRAPAEPACETIPAELMMLDKILGPDADEPRKQRPQVVRWAGGAVRSMVPYRGVVRFLTRADRRDHQAANAAMAGYARRGFLRGLEANLHCAAVPDLTPRIPSATVASARAAAVPVAYASAPPNLAPDAPADLTTAPVADLTPQLPAATVADAQAAATPVYYASAPPSLAPEAAPHNLATLMLRGPPQPPAPDDGPIDPGR